MNRTLLWKELREHGWAIGVLFAVAAMLFGVTFLAGLRDGAPAFDLLRRHLLFAVPLVAWFLGGRVVRKEYAGRTQLFLDALPIARSSVVTAKLLVCAGALVLCTAPAFLVTWILGLMRTDVTAAHVAIVATRTAGYLALVLGVNFLLGFLGRYRAALAIVAIVFAAYLAARTQVNVFDQGAFALVGTDFATERDAMPWNWFAASAGTAAVTIVCSYAFSALRDGSVAARLAQEMSQRERAFAAVVIVASFAGLAMWDGKRPKPPFDPPAAAEVKDDGLRVVVGAGSRMTEAEAARLAEAVHGRLTSMRRALGIATLPPVYLFARTGLDARFYERGSIEDEAGIIVRVRHPAPDWDEEHFLAWLVHRVIAEHTHSRATLEPRHWVLDGFATCGGALAAADEPLDRSEHLLLRALHGTPHGITQETLDTWDSLRLERGNEIANAVAWSGLRTLHRLCGEDRMRAFLAEALGREPADDLRGTFHEFGNGIGDLLERHTGLTPAAFLTAWNAALDGHRPDRSAALEAVALPAADVRVVGADGPTCEIEYVPRIEGAAIPGARVQFQWAEVSPFDGEPAESQITNDDVDVAAAATGRRLPVSLRRGATIVWRVARQDPSLGCLVASPFRRLVIE